MGKVNAEFTICLINRDLVVNTWLSDEFDNHNHPVPEFLLSNREVADKKPDSGEYTIRESCP